MANTFDVIISGAGMAGVTLALALEAGGLKTALIDPVTFAQQDAPAYDGRTAAIAYACFRQWRALGLGEAMTPHAGRIDKILVTDGRPYGPADPAPLPFYLRFDADEIGESTGDEPLGYMLENRKIRQVLAEAALERSLAVFAPARIQTLEQDAAGVTVTLDTGETLRAPLLVSAEGRGSATRKAAGVEAMLWDYKQSAVVATFTTQRPHQNIAYEHFLPGGPFAILPLTGDRVNLVWTETTARAEALREARPEVFTAILQRRFGDFLGGLTMAGPRFVYPLKLELASDFWKGRIALVGDSAHGVHPIAGQGLNLGLKDVAALAQVLIEARRRGEDIGAGLTLERYAAWRRFDTVSLAFAFDGFVRLFSNDLPPIRLARGLGLGLSSAMGPVRRFLMQEAGGAVGDLPRLLQGLPV